MSLAIPIERVTEVLLADGWHTVADQSLDLDSYEFKDGESMVLRGGQVAGVASTGFYFLDPDGMAYAGPLTSILATRWQWGTKDTR